MDDSSVHAAVDAWRRIKRGQKRLVGDWLTIGKALILIRDNVDGDPRTPRNAPLKTKAFGKAIEEFEPELAEIDFRYRAAAIFIAENEGYLSLIGINRPGLNDPKEIMRAIKAAQKKEGAAKVAAPKKKAAKTKKNGSAAVARFDALNSAFAEISESDEMLGALKKLVDQIDDPEIIGRLLLHLSGRVSSMEAPKSGNLAGLAWNEFKRNPNFKPFGIAIKRGG